MSDSRDSGRVVLESQVVASASRQGGSPQETSLPSWLTCSQQYTARADHEGFLIKSAARIAEVLRNLKFQRGGLGVASALDVYAGRIAVPVRLFGLLVTVVCVSAARNMFFVYIVLAIYLLQLALRPGSEIIDRSKAPLAAAAFSAVLMAPAAFWGQPTSLVRVSLKVLVTVGFVINLARSVPNNELIAGLRAFHVPGLIIFVLDITLKYIVMLGDVAMGVIEAVQVRSVGRNDDKRGASSGILGVTFLKAHDFSAEMYEAMECRGFSGDYVVPRRRIARGPAVGYLVLIAFEVLTALYLAGVL